MLSLALFSSAFVIKTFRSMRIYDIIESLYEFGKYPHSIFPKAINLTLSFLFPLFIIASLPAEIVLKGFYNLENYLFSFIVVLVILILAIKIWFLTIKGYSSAGG
jgi:ABC-2 type transport system permease protein